LGEKRKKTHGSEIIKSLTTDPIGKKAKAWGERKKGKRRGRISTWSKEEPSGGENNSAKMQGGVREGRKRK